MNETTNRQNKKQTKKKAGIKKNQKKNQYGLSNLLKLELPLIIQFRKHKQNLPLRSMTVLWFNKLTITPVNCRVSGPFALSTHSPWVRSPQQFDPITIQIVMAEKMELNNTLRIQLIPQSSKTYRVLFDSSLFVLNELLENKTFLWLLNNVITI